MDEQGGAGLSPRMITLVADARAQWAELDRRIAAFDAEFIRWTKENEEARRLASIPGVGPIIASALDRRRRSRARVSSTVAICRVAGSGSDGSSPPAASRSCSESASAATNICANN